jgi:hypothetical protein
MMGHECKRETSWQGNLLKGEGEKRVLGMSMIL